MAEFKKLNGRPKLKEGIRNKKIDVRFSEDEYRLIIAMEDEFGISKTELVRIRVLYNANKVVVNSKELIRQLDIVGAEMGRAGNNINQLAKYANTMQLMGSPDPGVLSKFNELMEGYIVIQHTLEISLRKIIRMMGK